MNNYTIWLTTDCNLRCRYCYEGVEKKAIIMEQDLAAQVVDFICETFDDKNEELCIDFHGGEPLLNYKILALLVGMVLFVVNEANRVENQVIMQMVFIDVSCQNKLILAA